MPGLAAASTVAPAARLSAIDPARSSGIAHCCEVDWPLGAEGWPGARWSLDEWLDRPPAVDEGSEVAPEGHAAALPQLVQHVLEHYHRRLRDDLPVLQELAVKVARRHGAQVPALHAVRELVAQLVAVLGAHLESQELVLFPLALRLASGGAAASELDAPLGEMEREQQVVTGLLERLRCLAGGFTPPAWACDGFRQLYALLGELEEDTHEHLQLETEVLFPLALRNGR